MLVGFQPYLKLCQVGVIASVLQMRVLKLKEFKWHAQEQMADEDHSQNQDSKPRRFSLALITSTPRLYSVAGLTERTTRLTVSLHRVERHFAWPRRHCWSRLVPVRPQGWALHGLMDERRKAVSEGPGWPAGRWRDRVAFAHAHCRHRSQWCGSSVSEEGRKPQASRLKVTGIHLGGALTKAAISPSPAGWECRCSSRPQHVWSHECSFTGVGDRFQVWFQPKFMTGPQTSPLHKPRFSPQ